MSWATNFLRGRARKTDDASAEQRSPPRAIGIAPVAQGVVETAVADAPEPALSADEAMALLAEGVRAFEAAETDRALRIFGEVEASGRLGEWAAFRIGMLERQRGDEAAAKAAFDRALHHAPGLFWAHFERLRLPTVRTDRGVRDRFAEALLDIDWEALQPTHVAEVEAVAGAIWRDGKRDLAGRLLARLWPSDSLGAEALDRIVETAIDPVLVEAAAARRAAMPSVREPGPARSRGSGADQAAFEAAVANFGAGRLDLAGAGFEALIDSAAFGGWANFYLGRIYTRESDQTRAWQAFDAAIAAEPTLFWAHFERAVLANALLAPVDTLVAYVAQMCDLTWEPLQESHVRDLERVAHSLWDRSKRAEAARLLSKLWPFAPLGRLALVRIVEDGSDRDLQRQAVDRLHGGAELDGTALRVLAEYHKRHGEGDREIASLEQAFQLKPQDFDTWIGLVRSYAAQGERSRANITIGQGAAFSAKQRQYAALIANVELGDVEEAFLGYRDYCRLQGEVPKFLGIRIAYRLGDLFDVVRRNEVIGILRSNYPGDRDVALVLINVAMRDQRWRDARAVFDEHFTVGPEMPRDVRQAHIDILAYNGELDEAARLVDLERVDGKLPTPFLRLSIRISSELERWTDVFETGLSQLGDDDSFGQFLSVLVRAARKVGGGDRLLDALLALPRPLTPEQTEAIHAVAEDLAEDGRADVLARIEEIELPSERRRRIALKLRSAAAPLPVEQDLCIYYCADRAYLTPALVSLTSLAMSNASVARRAVFHLVVDTDVAPFATEAAGAIGRRLGLTLEVIDAATVVSSADRLRTGYGLFTGGQQLALAAYYRIFFARWLVERKRFAQALYVDADTIVRGGLDELFALEDGAALLARRETDRPEVRHATALHGLEGAYFNSGVLRFDLRHPELPALLDRTIAAATDPEVELVFQDQCALNIAFDLKLSDLPDRFNHFTPPTVSGDGIPASDAVIVHFLDRPKPWDGLYRQPAREWFEWFELVETLRRQAAPDD